MAIQVFNHLKNENLSKKEIAQKLGKTKPTRHLNDLMRKLVKDGFVEYIIPEKPNSRLQKYRLTEKGKQLITTKHTKDTK
jgi:ATP-dependent DNA helicase RecG